MDEHHASSPAWTAAESQYPGSEREISLHQDPIHLLLVGHERDLLETGGREVGHDLGDAAIGNDFRGADIDALVHAVLGLGLDGGDQIGSAIFWSIR